MFKVGETVKIKTPVSFQRFVGHVLQVNGETVKVKTHFKIKGQDVWIVSACNVSSCMKKENAVMHGSPSLERELHKVTRLLK